MADRDSAYFWWRPVAIVAGYLAVYLAVLFIATALSLPQRPASWHPPDGVHLALLLIFGIRYAPAIVPAYLIGAYIFGLVPGGDFFAALVTAVVLAVGYVFAAFSLLRLLRIEPRLPRFRDALWFTVVGFLSPFVIGALVVTTWTLFGIPLYINYGIAVLQWWVSHGLGVITVAPFLLVVCVPAAEVLSARKRRHEPMVRWPALPIITEAILWLLFLAPLLWLVLLSPIADAFHFFYLLLIPVIWAAIRGALPGAVSAIFLMNHLIMLFIWGFGIIFFNVPDLQLFILMLTVTGLIVGGAITEQRYQAQQREMSERRYRQLFEYMNESMAVDRPVYDTDGVMVDWIILDVNPAFVDVSGFSRERIVGKRASEVYPIEDVRRNIGQLARVVREQRPVRLEYHATKLNKDFLLSAFPLGDENFAALNTDITPIREADRAKDQFIMVLSHELRTPLSNILGWLNMAQQRPEVMPQAHQVIERNARQLQEKLENLIDMARLLHGALLLETRVSDLWTIARERAEATRAAAAARKITLELNPPEEALLAVVDARRIGKAIDHLLENAIKFTDPGGTVTIFGRCRGGQVALCVRDTGRGLSDEQVDALFTPFRQISRDERAGGLGIGLVLVKGIVDLHGGNIYAESEGLGKGATFLIELPAADECRTSPDAGEKLL